MMPFSAQTHVPVQLRTLVSGHSPVSRATPQAKASRDRVAREVWLARGRSPYSAWNRGAAFAMQAEWQRVFGSDL